MEKTSHLSHSIFFWMERVETDSPKKGKAIQNNENINILMKNIYFLHALLRIITTHCQGRPPFPTFPAPAFTDNHNNILTIHRNTD
jgi:hypothetical protein